MQGNQDLDSIMIGTKIKIVKNHKESNSRNL